MAVVEIKKNCGETMRVLDGVFVLDNAGTRKVLDGEYVICNVAGGIGNTSIFEVTFLDGTSQTFETDLDYLDDYVMCDLASIKTCNFKQIKSTVYSISGLFYDAYNMTDFICNADLKNVDDMQATKLS